jgi:hypothetical protein
MLGFVGDTRSERDKSVPAAIALSVLFTGRSQRFSGLSKLFGVAFVLMGINRDILNILTTTRLCCSYSAAIDLLDSFTLDNYLTQVDSRFRLPLMV